jgi:hypothetical protein
MQQGFTQRKQPPCRTIAARPVACIVFIAEIPSPLTWLIVVLLYLKKKKVSV